MDIRARFLLMALMWLSNCITVNPHRSISRPEIRDASQVLRERSEGILSKAVLIAMWRRNTSERDITTLKQSLLHAIDTLGPMCIDIANGMVQNNTAFVLPNGSLHIINYLRDNDIEPSGSLLMFDDIAAPLEYTRIDSKYWRNTGGNAKMHALQHYLSKRYERKVTFISSRETLELRWAHAKGNFQLAQLSSGGHTPLVLHSDENTATQYTSGGHLFVTLPTSAQEVSFPVSEIQSMYLVPASAKPIPIVDMSELSGISSSNFGIKPILCEQNRDECTKLLFEYWEMQRLTQVWVDSWSLKSLFPTVDPGDLVFQLPDKLYREILNNYLEGRENLAKTEPLISTVFNQISAPTYHVPVKHSLLDELSNFVTGIAVNLMSTSPGSLQTTGAYGVREYTRSAIINWHTDPKRTQPITAIIHITNSGLFEPNKNGSSAPWLFEYSNLDIGSVLDSKAVNITRIELNPGEFILLESARLPHGRTTPLQEEWYGNVFVHLAPHGWGKYIDDIP